MDVNIDAELAALSEAIAAESVMAGLGESIGSEADKDRLHLALKEKIGELLPSGAPAVTTDDTTQVPVATTTTKVKKAQVGSKSYLDTVDDATVAKVNGYVAEAFQKGIKATLRKVIAEDPFVLDVFHDVLTDKLYSELKSRGLVK